MHIRQQQEMLNTRTSIGEKRCSTKCAEISNRSRTSSALCFQLIFVEQTSESFYTDLTARQRLKYAHRAFGSAGKCRFVDGYVHSDSDHALTSPEKAERTMHTLPTLCNAYESLLRVGPRQLPIAFTAHKRSSLLLTGRLVQQDSYCTFGIPDGYFRSIIDQCMMSSELPTKCVVVTTSANFTSVVYICQRTTTLQVPASTQGNAV